uniref:Uncharacterized protein n=1 Tax=Plectus sambesii TaxID=2011161 RepID=A0A914VYX5_9BILA
MGRGVGSERAAGGGGSSERASPSRCAAPIGVFCSGGLQRRAATTARRAWRPRRNDSAIAPRRLAANASHTNAPHRSPQFTAAASHYRFASVVRPSRSSCFFAPPKRNHSTSARHDRPARPPSTGPIDRGAGREWPGARARAHLRPTGVGVAVANSAQLIVVDRRQQHPTDPLCALNVGRLGSRLSLPHSTGVYLVL